MDKYNNFRYITPNNPQGLPVKQTKHPALIAIICAVVLVIGYLAAVAALMVGGVYFYVYATKTSLEKKQLERERETKYSFIKDEAKQQLINHGMNAKNKYTVADYAKITEVRDDYLSKGDYTIIWGYYRVIGSAETEKLLMANGFQDWNEFLLSQGCVNTRGEADISMWKQKMYRQLEEKSAD